MWSSSPKRIRECACRAHTAHFEAAFWADLKALNCRMPHAAPRVTEHMPEVVAYIDKIIEQGFAYPAGAGGSQSVYFDVRAFRQAGHTYGKLKPWAVRFSVLCTCVSRTQMCGLHRAWLQGPRTYMMTQHLTRTVYRSAYRCAVGSALR